MFPFYFPWPLQQETSEPSIEQEDNALYYEVKEFVRIINENIWAPTVHFHMESKDVMQVYENTSQRCTHSFQQMMKK